MKDKILIVGSGAMATLFAARLSAGGIGVSVLGTWQEGLDAFRKNGAGITDANGSEHFFPVDTLSPGQHEEKFRFAIVLVKSWQTCKASSALAEWLEPDGKCLTLQNGLGNRECLEEYLGSNRVIMGVTTTGGTLLAPGRVTAGGEGIITIEKQSGMEALIQMLNHAGFEIKLVDDAKSLIWGKLVINAAINPLSAILGAKNGQLLENSDTSTLMDELSLETSAVANALGIKLPYDDPAAESRKVAERTASNKSSMLQDMLRGAPTEIEAINGAIWNLGKELDIPTPANEVMTRLIRAMVWKSSTD